MRYPALATSRPSQSGALPRSRLAALFPHTMFPSWLISFLATTLHAGHHPYQAIPLYPSALHTAWRNILVDHPIHNIITDHFDGFKNIFRQHQVIALLIDNFTLVVSNVI